MSLFTDTLEGKKTERPPMWFMRQAGRVLPNYMKLKEQYSFWQLMQDPKLAAEVTLMPIEDLKTDAAILFSDILVIPYAMGMGLDFTDKGPVFEKPLKDAENPLAQLNPQPEKLQYIYNAIDEIIKTKPADIPLIGFCGGPLTVLLYMLQGLSRKHEFPDAVKYIYQNKETVRELNERIAELSITYATEQVKHGISAFQLFETHAGLIPAELYLELFMPAVEKISRALKAQNMPFIFFPKGFGAGIHNIKDDLCDFYGVDWQTPLHIARKVLPPNIGIQGNIDPRLLYASQERIASELSKLIDFHRKNDKWILNFGHGFLPDIPYKNARFMTDWLRKADW
jgi:uroporphyrinogen decarboxylase